MRSSTPGMLNPLSFDTPEEFEAALNKQGEDQGWHKLDPEVPEKPVTPQEAFAQRRGLR